MHAFNAAFKVAPLFSDRRRKEEIPYRVPTRCATFSGEAVLQQRSSR
jgi:hypothetical protein